MCVCVHVCVYTHTYIIFQIIFYFVCGQSLIVATPWTAILEDPLSLVIFQARTLEWVVFPTPGDLSNPGIKPESPVPQIGRWILFH